MTRLFWAAVFGTSAGLVSLAIRVGARDWFATAILVALAVLLVAVAAGLRRRATKPNAAVEQLRTDVRSLSERLKTLEVLIALQPWEIDKSGLSEGNTLEERPNDS